MVRVSLRPEAVPAHDDGDVGRVGRAQPVAGHERGPGDAGAAIPTRPAASAWPSRRRSRTPPRQRHQLRAGLRAEPRAPPPDRDRAGGAEADRAGRRAPGRRDRLRRRRAATSPGSRSRSSATRSPAPTSSVIACEPAACPTLTRGPLRLRLRRHRPADAARRDAHARPRLRPPGIHAGGLRYHGAAPIVLASSSGRAPARPRPTARTTCSPPR